MTASTFPGFRDFLEVNKPVWREYKYHLVVSAILAFILWLYDVFYGWNISGMPTHFIPELYFLSELGCFLADVKESLVPTELVVVVTYVFGWFVILSVLGFSVFSLFVGLIMGSALPLGYVRRRIGNWRKTRRR